MTRKTRTFVATAAECGAIVLLIVYLWDKPPSWLLAAAFWLWVAGLVLRQWKAETNGRT